MSFAAGNIESASNEMAVFIYYIENKKPDFPITCCKNIAK